MTICKRIAWISVAAAAPMLLAACTTGGFDSGAYESAVDLKYETLILLDKATARYATAKKEADALVVKLDAAAENAAKNLGNTAVAEQWAAIRDPRGSSAGNAIELWKKAPLRPGQRAEKKRAVAAHFDHLICLEKNRMTQSDCGEVGLAATPSVAAATAAATPAPKPAAAAKPAPAEPAEPAAEEEPKQ